MTTNEEMIASIVVRGTRGAAAGLEKTPHRTKDGRYIATMTRFAKDYIYVSTYEEIVRHVRDGYGLRMSVAGGPASLISAKVILEQNPQLLEA